MGQQAPRASPSSSRPILVVIGVVGTFLGLIPDVAGIEGEMIGIGAFVAASLLMIAGLFVRGL